MFSEDKKIRRTIANAQIEAQDFYVKSFSNLKLKHKNNIDVNFALELFSLINKECSVIEKYKKWEIEHLERLFSEFIKSKSIFFQKEFIEKNK